MTTATDLWPPGGKYDIHEIRERLKTSLLRQKEPIVPGKMPISAMLANSIAARLSPNWHSHHETESIDDWWSGSSNYCDQGPPRWFDEFYDWYEWVDIHRWGTRSSIVWKPDIDAVTRNRLDIHDATSIEVIFDDVEATCTCLTHNLPFICQSPPHLKASYSDPKFEELIDHWLTQEASRVIDTINERIKIPTLTCEYGDSQLYHGDCRQVLPHLSQRPSFLFADPPFNIGHNYEGFCDNLSESDYRLFTCGWIRAAEECLADDGVMAIHVPDDVVPLVLEAVSFPRISWIIWHYRFGQCHRYNWVNSKAHCLVFAKNPDKYTWNPGNVLVETDRATTYKDNRTQQSATPGLRVPLDVWGIPSDGPYWGRVQGNSKERRAGHPNQLPEVYLDRLIRAYTNPGDLVLDPFIGSGTTAVVAEALGRKSIGIDVSQPNVDSAFERIQKGAVRVPSS